MIETIKNELAAYKQKTLEVLSAKSGTLSVEDFVKTGAISADQGADLQSLARRLLSGDGGPGTAAIRHDRAIFVNATSTGGGVAEMRFDTVALLRSLGFSSDGSGSGDQPSVQWLVMDGSPTFFEITAHMHEAMQNAHQPALPPGASEILQTVWLHNFERLERDGYITPENAGRTLFWIDDPQPAGLVPLIRAIYPRAIVIWRCHVDTTEPQEETIRLVLDTVEGRIKGNPKLALLERYLDQRNWTPAATAEEGARALAAHRVVFHRQQFVDGAGIDTGATKPVLTPPAVNPLALKNCEVSSNWVAATFARYGILPTAEKHAAGDPSEWPPVACEISRFDPYKGPLECVVAFSLALRSIADRDPDSNVPARARLVFAGNIPGDNLRGLKLYEHCVSFTDHAVDPDANPMFAGPLADLRKRIHLLKLPCANAAEVVSGLLLPLIADESAKAAAHALLDRLGSGEVSGSESGLLDDARAMLEHVISACGLSDSDITGGISSARAAAADAATDVLVLTPAQRSSASNLWPELAYGGAGGVPEGRLRTGKVMNHLEVNALVTGSSVRLQFSSREGFGLVVTEAMIKKPAPPFGVVVATLVGGICDQVTEDGSTDTTESPVALPAPYLPEDIRGSLSDYQALPQGDGQVLSPQQSRELFDRISSRHSVREFAAQMARAFEMSEQERETMARAAFRRAQDLFSTPANVRKILETFNDVRVY